MVARLGKARGLRGELLARGYRQPAARFQALRQVWLRNAQGRILNEGAPLHVVEVKSYKDGLIVRFQEVPDRTAAEQFEGCEICIPESERPAPAPDEYYLADLLDCTVFDQASGRVLGVVTAWHEYGGPPLLEVFRQGRKDPLLLPFARSILAEVDLAAKRIVVALPEGLEDLDVSG